ncbi:MAG: 5-(carboxyamino)imidazole ribonucleotide synthase [Fluviicola sp.]
MKKQWQGRNFRLGMLGGGQLGRMFIQEALNYDVHVHCLDADPEAPCSLIASSFTVASLNDYDAVMAFGQDKDVITVEIENVSTKALAELEKQGKKVFPQARVLEIIKDKGTQKEFYATHNLPTAPFELIADKNELTSIAHEFPFVLKLRTGGYDGKGVQIIRSEKDLETAFDAPCIIEKMIPFEKELSVIVARNESGETKVYPTVECEFNPDANLVEFLFSPAEISKETELKAQEIALNVIDKLEMVGLLAVELFLTADGEILINEIAPRPHNSGHHTIECCYTSQFEQHLRSIVNAPLGNTDLIVPGVMINLLGAEGSDGKAKYEFLEEAMEMQGVAVHLYGKEKTKSFRKMGHVTVYHPDLNYCKETGLKLLNSMKVTS